jgi:hemoglobin
MSTLASPSIDEVAVRNLVTTFYLRVSHDPTLAPVFERAIGKTDAEWATHLSLLREFLSSIMLSIGHDRGSLMLAHLHLPDLEPAVFERWLSLFAITCTDLFEPEMASAFHNRAVWIAESLGAR